MRLASQFEAFTGCAAEGWDLPGRRHERADSEPGAGRRAGAVPGRKHSRRARHDQPGNPIAHAALPRAPHALAGAQRVSRLSRKPQRAPLALAGAQRVAEVSRGTFWRAPPAPGAQTTFAVL